MTVFAWLLLAVATATEGEQRLPHAIELAGGVELVPTGYLDVGFFDAASNGVAYRWDFDEALYGGKRWDAYAWGVFYGDPWANMVNSQGESADLGGTMRPRLDRTDRIASLGMPTFLVNTVSQGMELKAGRDVEAVFQLDFEPRNGDRGALGDAVSVDTAYIRWWPSERSDLRVEVGKVESAFGIEYRYRRAPDRFNITPSLVSRYTTGTPTGVRARGSIRKVLHYTVAVTSGSTVTERFGHVSDELDRNGVPTGTARLGLRSDGRVRVEIGGSGSVGPQDEQPDPTVLTTQYGGDLLVEAMPVKVRAEYVVSRHEGNALVGSDALDAVGGYVETWVYVRPGLGPLVRVDRRDALLFSNESAYVSDVVRLTAGLHWELQYNLLAKVEYLHLIELTRGGDIPNDVLTSSVVFHF